MELHNKPIKQITTTTTKATHPPAINADINAFVPAIIALTVDTVALTTAFAP